MDEILLDETELGERLREWLNHSPDRAFTLVVERLGGGKVLLRPLPEASPELIAHLRVTMARYREVLMNLT